MKIAVSLIVLVAALALPTATIAQTCPPRPGLAGNWCVQHFRHSMPAVPMGSTFSAQGAMSPLSAGYGVPAPPMPMPSVPMPSGSGVAIGTAFNGATWPMACVIDNAGDYCQVFGDSVPSGTPCNCNGYPGYTQ